MFHRENSHPLWTIFRFGIVNVLSHLCRLHFEVLFLRCLPICYGACKDNHHGHKLNIKTNKHYEIQKKKKRTEKKKRNRTEQTGTNIISQLQATVMATCWPVCILNHKPLGDKKTKQKNRDWAFPRRKEHVQIPPKTTTNKEDFITESNVNVEVMCVNKTNFCAL